MCALPPERRLGDLDTLTAEERRHLLQDLNPPPTAYPAATLHGMFVAQARRTPRATAVIDGDTAVSYAELDAASNRVAQRLAPLIRRPGEAVAVAGPRSSHTLAAKLGVMKAGAAFVHLDAGLPAGRAAQLCALARVVAVLVARHVPAPRTTAALLGVEDVLADPATPADPVEELADESTAAYVLFTSGSTGEPKGVVRPHRMNTTRVMLERRLYGFGPADRHLLKALPFFRESLSALATGGAVVVARQGGEVDDAYLLELLRRERVTIASFVPSMLRLLLRHPGFRAGELALRNLFVAGEVLDPELERALRARGFAVRVTYTLAEADYVTHRGEPLADGEPATVGRPLDMRVYLCDAHERLVPPGLTGEIYTGGPGLADGYVGRPDLTAERFVANPFDPEAAPTLFRTGDLGRWRADGQLEFAGRADEQVKVRGQRVEPTEVEQVLRRHEAVEEAAVTGLPDPDAGHVLAAYVVLSHGDVTTPQLRAFLHEHLPSYMVPSHIVAVEAIPRLGSGKLDRVALRSAARRRPADLPRPAPPADEEERRVVAVWARVLGVDAVGVEDRFTDLGGDSLRAMLLRAALEDELGEPVRLFDLMRASTVRELCRQLAERKVRR